MPTFSYPGQRSTFDTVLSSEQPTSADGYIANIRTSAGYNICTPPFHVVGLHIGAPVTVLHRQRNSEKIYPFRAGDSFFAPVGASIEYAHPAAMDTLYIYLSENLIHTVADSIELDASQIVWRGDLGTHDLVIARIGQEALHELSTPGLGIYRYLDTLRTQLSIHLLRRYTLGAVVSPSPPPPVRRELPHALRLIQTHLHYPLTLDDLAASEHLTPFHFSRVFKQVYGLSPHQYIIRQRVQRAMDLFNTSQLTITEVALKVGFANHSHLIRHFKRLTGTTPRHFQQEYTQNSTKT